MHLYCSFIDIHIYGALKPYLYTVYKEQCIMYLIEFSVRVYKKSFYTHGENVTHTERHAAFKMNKHKPNEFRYILAISL